MMTKLFYFLVLFSTGVNGALYLAWFLTPPNPDRIGFWFLIYFIVFPVLGLLGFLGLIFRESLNISGWFIGILLLYVFCLTLLSNSVQLGFGWVIEQLLLGGFEVLHVVAFIAAFIGLLFVVQKR
jgi:hypothetical protein